MVESTKPGDGPLIIQTQIGIISYHNMYIITYIYILYNSTTYIYIYITHII